MESALLPGGRRRFPLVPEEPELLCADFLCGEADTSPCDTGPECGSECYSMPSSVTAGLQGPVKSVFRGLFQDHAVFCLLALCFLAWHQSERRGPGSDPT